MRHASAAALSARGTPSQPCHLCAGAGLVDEYQPLWIEIGLAVKPRKPG